jgi:hypothetical protein
MPTSDGVNALASWMLICVFFVFCALMCYAYQLWRLKPSLLKKHWKQEGRNEVIGKEGEGDGGGEKPVQSTTRKPSSRNVLHQLDVIRLMTRFLLLS